MSTITAIDREYLKKMVRKAINERTDPLEDPEIKPIVSGDLSGLIDQAVSIFHSKHKEQYENLLKGMSFESQWVLATWPEAGQPESISEMSDLSALKANAKISELIDYLTGLTFDLSYSGKEDAIHKITEGLSRFSRNVPHESFLRLEGLKFGEDSPYRYAESFWRFLVGKYKKQNKNASEGETNLNEEIMSLLNVRDSSVRDKSFSNFYNDELDKISKDASGILVSYVSHKLSKEQNFRSTVDSIIIILAILASFKFAAVTAGAVAGMKAAGFSGFSAWTIAIVIEYLVLEKAIAPALGTAVGAGEYNWKTVSISKDQAKQYLEDLLKDIPDDNSRVQKSNIDRYYRSIEILTEIREQFISEWFSEDSPAAKKLRRVYGAKSSFGDDSPTTARRGRTTEDFGTNRELRDLISYNLELTDQFYSNYEKLNKKTVDLSFAEAASHYIDEFRTSVGSWAAKMKTLPSAPASPAGGYGSTGGMSIQGTPRLREGAYMDTVSLEDDLNKKIANMLNTSPSEIEGLIGRFGEIHTINEKDDLSQFERYRKKTTKEKIKSLWGHSKRSYSSLIQARDAKKKNSEEDKTFAVANKHIEKIMSHGWCVFVQMPLDMFVGRKNQILNFGLITDEGGGWPVSFISSTNGTDIVQKFMEATLDGAIGMTKGKMYPPMHDHDSINEIAEEIEEIIDVARKIKDEFESTKRVRPEVLKQRLEFVDDYLLWLENVRDVLYAAAWTPRGDCAEANNFFKYFMTVEKWTSKIKR